MFTGIRRSGADPHPCQTSTASFRRARSRLCFATAGALCALAAAHAQEVTVDASVLNSIGTGSTSPVQHRTLPGTRALLFPPAEAPHSTLLVAPAASTYTAETTSGAETGATQQASTPTSLTSSSSTGASGGGVSTSTTETETTTAAAPAAAETASTTAGPAEQPAETSVTAAGSAATSAAPAAAAATTEEVAVPEIEPAPAVEPAGTAEATAPAAEATAEVAATTQPSVSTEPAATPETQPTETATSEPAAAEPAAAQPEPAAAPAATAEATQGAAATAAASTQTQTAAIPATAPVEGQIRIEFAEGSADLPEPATAQLDAIAQRLAADENARVQLLSYASGTPETASRSRRISLSRALAVRSYLIGKGVRSTRMDVRALGNTQTDGPADRVDIIPQAQ